MKKILIIGVKGMAGHMLYNYLRENTDFEVYGLARGIENTSHLFNLDVFNTTELKGIILDIQFDYVINCIGILNKDAEDNPAKAIWFNSYFPHFLANMTKDTRTKLIHISTDCVFSGREGAYSEDHVRDGVGFYSQSKALGEVDNTKDLTIRTSIIGPELNLSGIGLLHWFLNQQDGALIKGYTQAYWSGITTLELGKVILAAIDENITGLINIAPSEKINKYALLNLFNSIFKMEVISIEPYDGYVVDKSLKSKREDFSYRVPLYRDMLEQLKVWMIDHSILYPHYNIFKK